MSDYALRLPNGLRSISHDALREVLAALKEVKHTRLVNALIAIIEPEVDRRVDPMTEPAWPAIDTTDWPIDDLFRALRECLTLASLLSDPESRGLFRTVGHIVWSDFRHRVGEHVLPYSETNPVNEE